MMALRQFSRRNVLKGGLAISGGLLGLSFWQLFPSLDDTIPPVSFRNTPGPDEWMVRAETTFERLRDRFAVPGTDRFYNHVENRPGERPYADLWAYVGLLGALNGVAALPGKKAAYENALREALGGLEAYFDAGSEPGGYDSYLRAEGGGQKYYDDNEWVGLELLRAYQLLGDPVYLARAETAFRFALSGWSEAMGGGIYWREGDDGTKNTCSNAPAAILALLLYRETGDVASLKWALRILDWLGGLKPPGGGPYWDNLTKAGSIDQRTFTYNTGTVIHANALLYADGGEAGYLEEARALARASGDHFATRKNPGEPRLFPAKPWFNAVLLRGYLALREVDPAVGEAAVDLFRGYLEHAWENARGADGLFSPDPSGASGREDPHRWLLDQAGMVEMFALMGTV